MSINREAAPISKVMDKARRQLLIKVPLTDPPILCRGMEGRRWACLYLMDTDVGINEPWNRSISA